jgi:hypothetical protein
LKISQTLPKYFSPANLLDFVNTSYTDLKEPHCHFYGLRKYELFHPFEPISQLGEMTEKKKVLYLILGGY